MTDFPVGARVRIGRCEGEVRGSYHRVIVQLPDVGFPGYFDPKFVHLVEPVQDQPAKTDQSVELTALWGKVADFAFDALDARQRDRGITPVHTQTDMEAVADAVHALVAPVLAARDAKVEESLRIEEKLILDRDRCMQWADRLAEAIAPVPEIGEHSSANDPWANALEIARGLRAEIEKLNLEIQGYQVSDGYEKGHEHGESAACERIRVRLADAMETSHALTLDELCARVGELQAAFLDQAGRAREERERFEHEASELRAQRNETWIDRLRWVETAEKRAEELETVRAELEHERARHVERDEVNAGWVRYKDSVVKERREHRVALSQALGIAADDRGMFPPIQALVDAAKELRVELNGLKAKASTKWQWMTAPISEVQHLVPAEGDGRRVSFCDGAGSTTWREPREGDPFCAECTFGDQARPDTEPSEQVPECKPDAVSLQSGDEIESRPLRVFRDRDGSRWKEQADGLFRLIEYRGESYIAFSAGERIEVDAAFGPLTEESVTPATPTEPRPWTDFRAGERATATDLDGRTVTGQIAGFFAWDNTIGRNMRANMLLDDKTPSVVHAPSLREVVEDGAGGSASTAEDGTP